MYPPIFEFQQETRRDEPRLKRKTESDIDMYSKNIKVNSVWNSGVKCSMLLVSATCIKYARWMTRMRTTMTPTRLTIWSSLDCPGRPLKTISGNILRWASFNRLFVKMIIFMIFLPCSLLGRSTWSSLRSVLAVASQKGSDSSDLLTRRSRRR